MKACTESKWLWRSCDDGGWQLIPIFNNPHRKCRPSPSEAARTLEYLEGMPSYATSSGRKEKQVRINIQKALEYLEGGNEVIPKAQSLQSFFLTNLVANLWIRSRWLMSATRFGEQTGIIYTRCGRTKSPYKGIKADFERSWKERFIMKINRLALFAAAVHWAEKEK